MKLWQIKLTSVSDKLRGLLDNEREGGVIQLSASKAFTKDPGGSFI